ncbi:MAG TPA: hypothetical protein PKC43_02530 [Phycisphaerales bacterium]|nr:hypothetical protein [Phycisphaerales bacterium]HMP36302.1 hypothetical protein [Phycisphaerales bacterium]
MHSSPALVASPRSPRSERPRRAVASLAACAVAVVAHGSVAGICNPFCVGDIDDSGVVDGADLGLLLAAWDTSAPCADLNGDGTVDGADLGLLLGSWGPCSAESQCERARAKLVLGIELSGSLRAAAAAATQPIGAPESAAFIAELQSAKAVASAARTQLLSVPECPGVPVWDPQRIVAKLDAAIAGLDEALALHALLVEPTLPAPDFETIKAELTALLAAVGDALRLAYGQLALPAECPPATHSCCLVGAPGCDDAECCASTCLADPYCCAVAWDDVCVELAALNCDPGCAICVEADHACCVVGGPGCSDVACCEEICALEPSCCEIAWDILCVELVEFFCRALECPSPCSVDNHDCLTVGPPGCSDIACCEFVCAFDALCCLSAWDALCVLQAIDFCGAPPVPNDFCAEATPIGLGAAPFSTLGATTDGPPLPPECDEGFGLGFINDVWFLFVAPRDGLLTVSTCGTANYDTRLAAYEGAACFGPLVACNDDGAGCPGFTSLMSFETVAGTAYLIRIGGFSGSGTGTVELSY